MYLPRIAVTCSVTVPDHSRPPRVGVNDAYQRAIQEAGGLPLLIPPGLSAAAIVGVVEVVDGLLLPGGVDVAPHYYGEAAHPTTVVDPDLDALELALLNAILGARKPVLAICRGAQLLNVARGGALVQDLPSQTTTDIVHRSSGTERSHPAHELRIDPSSLLADALNASVVPVNSFHHQAIKELGAGLRVTGRAEDGTIEAIEGADPSAFVVGVQCHPEELVATSDTWRGLFTAFVHACRPRA